MISSPLPAKPSEVRRILTTERWRRPQGWSKDICKMPLRPSICNNDLYIDPTDKHLFKEPGDEEDETMVNTQAR